MAVFTSTLLLLSVMAVWITPISSQTEPMCDDQRESGDVSVLEGQAGWLSCPLFSHPSVYSTHYTSAQSAEHNHSWFHLPEGHDRLQPITYSSRLSKDLDRLWLQPAVAEDTGQYICMLRNKSSCIKITMRLNVIKLDEVAWEPTWQAPVALVTTNTTIPLQEGKTLECPNIQDAIKMADSPPSVTWYHVRTNRTKWNSDRQQRGTSLHFYMMTKVYQGLYVCAVSYLRRGRQLNFTRGINVTAVSSSTLPKEPTILHPTVEQVIPVKLDTEVQLVCRAKFPYLESPWEIWWTVDGKTLDELANQRFNMSNRHIDANFGDREEESVLVIQDFQSEDLDREYNCSVRNERGNDTRRARLEEEVSLPSVELGCGLGAILVLMLIVFVVYHVFRLELLLLYRSWFGTDERHTDDKEYDVYISYERNSEEEQFVLMTLRRVLENELGYSVCIFDRDSLPGGTITDETLSFVARSRRLLVVLSPGYASKGSQALLELKAGIDGMALDGHLRVILVQYKPVHRQGWVRELKRTRVALALVRWQGDKSKELTSRFWKRLRVELPVRRVGSREGEVDSKEVALMRLHSQNSTNSQTGLVTTTVKDPRKVFNYAA